MSSDDVEVEQLSASQQDTLQTYLAVTGQEPGEAIPLLQRSEWNTQIAITKFFDGEQPDPVAAAQAVPETQSPASTAPRVRENLMSNDIFDSIRPQSPSQSAEPASRISTQPVNQPPLRPPFILAILFSPFNFLYRILSGSFRLFGTLFPFLPRLLNTVTNSTLYRVRQGTKGRRSLSPKDTATRFIREFEEEYGTNSLPFLENGYNMAMEKSHQELKFLLVLLLSPEHDDTSNWVQDTLLSPEVVGFLNDSCNNVLLWGGNVQDSEAYQVSNSLRCTKFPFAAVVTHTPNVSSSAMSVIGRISGLTTPAEFIEKLQTAINQHKAPLDRVRATRAEQQASRSIRQEQDSAYERSLAQDRERARQRKEAEAQRQREEQEEQEKQAAAEQYARNLEQWKRWRAQSIPSEPPATDKEAVRISLRLTSGERVVRRFAGEADIEELYAFVECYDVTHGNEDSEATGPSEVQEPDGFEHKYGFRLVSPMPRTVYEISSGGTVKERVGRGGNLLVETIEDDDESEEE